MGKKFGIFGGTYEGRLLAEFCRREGINAVVSVATAYGSQLVEGEVCTGRMDAHEMAEWIKRQEISAVIDATHPFAQAVSEQLQSACAATHTEYMRLRRTDLEPPSTPTSHEIMVWPKETPDNKKSTEKNILWAASYEEAAALLHRELFHYPERTALLTTGSKRLSCFASEKSLLPRLFVRVLPSVESILACQNAGFCGKQIIAMQGPFSLELNQALLRATQASYLVTKESGQAGGFYEKAEAALLCGCQVIAIRRPAEEGEGKNLEEMKAWLKTEKAQYPPANPGQKNKKQQEIILLGIGMGSLEQLTWEGIQALGKADAFLGASRMVESGKALCRRLFSQTSPELRQEWIPLSDKQERITYKKEEMLSWLNEHPEITHPVILFSGDSGFYSGAKGVLELLKTNYPSLNIRLLPGISSLSCFAAKIGRPWENTEPISFHGREEELDWSFSDGKERFFLLDGTERLHQICRRLIAHGQSDAAVWIGENLSYPNERILCEQPEAVLQTTFEPLLICWVVPSPKNTGASH